MLSERVPYKYWASRKEFCVVEQRQRFYTACAHGQGGVAFLSSGAFIIAVLNVIGRSTFLELAAECSQVLCAAQWRHCPHAIDDT